MPGIVAAIEQARAYEDRLAFVVPTGRTFENEAPGRQLNSKQTLQCVLLLADRVFGDRPAATTGNEEAPGIIALGELVVAQLTGADLDLMGVCLQPGDGQPFTLDTEAAEELSGREVWAQEFTTPCGTIVTGRARPGTVRSADT